MASGTEAPPESADVAPLHKVVAALQDWMARVRENYRVSLRPRTEVEARLVHAQLTMVRESTKATVITAPLIGGLIAFYRYDALPWSHMLGWWLALTLACVISEVGAARWRSVPSAATPENTRRMATAHTITTIAITLVWTSMIFLLWIPGDELDHIVLVLLLSASLATASSVSAPHYASSRAALWIYGVVSVIGPIVMSGTINYIWVALTSLFAMGMSANMRSNFETACKMLSLQDERSGMIANLRAAKKESDIARDRAEKASRAKSQFLANMSHELRTPMNAILGFSEMIETNQVLDQAKCTEYAHIINQSGQHLLGLINDILDLAKIESGTMQLRESRVALPHVVDECIQLLGAKAYTSGLALISDLPASLPDVQADERALRQIIINLLSNALKFTPTGGQVQVFAEIRPDNSVALGVRDTGVGIAAEDQKHVFENFGQGRHDVVTLDKGTGLGLPIVKGLIEAHGGRVEMQSAVGSGTCVTVIIPESRVVYPSLTRLAS
jgi:two-component system cell cycle sensor histidine kinase PleC